MAVGEFIVLGFLSLYMTGCHAVESLRFFAIGDMGGLEYEPYITYFERCNADQMGKMADLYSPQFILELGDNFYDNGVTSVDDMRFNVTFESVYTAKSLQVPWYLVAGNHDHHGNVTAQILYSKVSKRWNFPSPYYYKEFPFADGKHSVGIIFIDTVLLCGNTYDDVQEQPNGQVDKKMADDQWKFIEETLKKSRATYLFTAGHYPVWSASYHGPTKQLVSQLLPLLDRYKANGHFCGHDHNLQHLRTNSSTGAKLDYFVSGMANTCDPLSINRDKVPQGSLLFTYGDLLSRGGFLYAETTVSNMTLTFINGFGKQLYSTVVYPRKL